VLTDRGRWILALGGGIYLAAWALGSEALYPIALGLVLAVAAAALWVRYLRRPMQLRRRLGKGERLAGDDVTVQVELDEDGIVPSGALVLRERITKLGDRETPLVRRHGRLRGRYTLRRVPRGRYPVEQAEIVIEDPFGLERVSVELPSGAAILVYPRLVELDRLFSESGARTPEGRRLLMRRPTGFDLHSVREYEQGESLRRVHWPSTAKRGQLMVKELEDSPKDSVAVLLDCDPAGVAGTSPDSSFDAAVRAAGSVLRHYAMRARRATLLTTGRGGVVHRVTSMDRDFDVALGLLAAAEPDALLALAPWLRQEASRSTQSGELVVVTTNLGPAALEAILATAGRRLVSVVWVDAPSYVKRPTRAASGPLRLAAAGIPLAVVRHGEDLAAALDFACTDAEVVARA
jgi:uncharacterized protein (DUF58 family)